MTEFGFDRRNGELLVGAAAVELRQEEAGADVLSLPDLLVTPDFPFVPGDFERPKKEWDQDTCIAIGQWTLNMLEPVMEQPKTIHKEHVRRLHVLGLGPGIKEVTVKNGFTNFTDFKQQVGALMFDVRGIYNSWGVDQVISYVDELWGDKWVTKEEIDNAAGLGLGPSSYVLVRIFGTVRELNEMRGFYDVHDWKRPDYVRWGAKVIIANAEDTSQLTTTVADILSKRRRGPSWRSVLSRFGTWASFREKAISFYPQLLEEEKQARLKLISESPYPVAKKSSLKIKHFSSTKATIDIIRKSSPDIEITELELLARKLGIFNSLWPPDNFRQNLKVTDSQLKAARKKAAQSRRRYPANYVKRSAS